jgi:ABC-type histidine transport system ATPase subunit
VVLESRLDTAMVVSGVGCLANAGDMPLSGGDDGCCFSTVDRCVECLADVNFT